MEYPKLRNELLQALETLDRAVECVRILAEGESCVVFTNVDMLLAIELGSYC